MRLPDDVKLARSHCKISFESWKEKDYPDRNETCKNYRSKRREYRFKLRNFLNQLEAEKIMKLCNAAYTNEKLFWRFLKGHRLTSQMTASSIYRRRSSFFSAFFSALFRLSLGPILYPLHSKNWSLDRMVAIV